MVNKISINAKDNTVVELHELVSVKERARCFKRVYFATRKIPR